MSNRPAITLGLLVLAASAHAASDLAVSISAPVGARVYDTARYTVDVRNIGNKTAASVVLTIQLPLTHTSPTTFPMADVVGLDSRCTLAGSRMTCLLGNVSRNTSRSVYADLRFPYSVAPMVIEVNGSTPSAENTYANNSPNHVVSLGYHNASITQTVGIMNQHCTGQSLTSFRECECFPSSIASHSAVLNFDVDRTISFPLYGPQYGGTWSQPTADRLLMQYTEDGIVTANFDGRGVSGNCFEGITTFEPTSGYMSVYKVCLQ
jgi:hypothetical protein